jgi:chromosomal replication initiation ATPase DnaA
MEELAVRIVTPDERRARLSRLRLQPEPKQLEEAHEIFFKGGFTKIETIQRAVLVEFRGVTLADIKSRRRTANVVKPRQIGMFLSREMTNQSLPDIGRRFGGRDHTTVLHAYQKIGRLAEVDDQLYALLNRIRARVEEYT